MKKEKILVFGSILFLVLLIIFLIVKFNISSMNNTNRKEELENDIYNYVESLEAYIELSRNDSNIENIGNGIYSIKQLKDLGFKVKSEMANDDSVVKINIYDRVEQGWFNFDDNYKVYYSVAENKANASNTGDYIDNRGRLHNEVPKATGAVKYY